MKNRRAYPWWYWAAWCVLLVSVLLFIGAMYDLVPGWIGVIVIATVWIPWMAIFVAPVGHITAEESKPSTSQTFMMGGRM